MGNLRDKNDRALRAFLAPAIAAVNAKIPIYITTDPETRAVTTGPGLVDVKTVQGPESPQGVGGYTFSVLIRAKMPGVGQPNQKENDNRDALGQLINAIHDRLHLSDNNQDYAYTAQAISQAGNALTTAGSADDQKSNTDMGDYSCLAVIHGMVGGDRPKDEVDLNFVEVLHFQMSVVGYGGYWN